MFNTQQIRTRLEGVASWITSRKPLDINPQENHENIICLGPGIEADTTVVICFSVIIKTIS